eukprot:1161734-Pelagomonas_calceolata.AAC.14
MQHLGIVYVASPGLLDCNADHKGTLLPPTTHSHKSEMHTSTHSLSNQECTRPYMYVRTHAHACTHAQELQAALQQHAPALMAQLDDLVASFGMDPSKGRLSDLEYAGQLLKKTWLVNAGKERGEELMQLPLDVVQVQASVSAHKRSICSLGTCALLLSCSSGAMTELQLRWAEAVKGLQGSDAQGRAEFLRDALLTHLELVKRRTIKKVRSGARDAPQDEQFVP